MTSRARFYDKHSSQFHFIILIVFCVVIGWSIATGLEGEQITQVADVGVASGMHR